MIDQTTPPEGAAPELLCVYLLMRTDMASMNAGKGHAQSHHAGTQMALKDRQTWTVTQQNWLRDWAESRGFGTVLTMGCDNRQMNEALAIATRLGFPCAVVNDPSYPLLDGSVVHLFPLDTCAYIFGPKIAIERAVAPLDLHP
ncbi:peptidyl-tRNA hydrolase [Brevundimonas phage vB_BpoS-Papperlapapp]|nr:peptidyl-tRNA hydrolase [Brevundimonas phage vB_BpoS-Papperlapapp]